MATPKPVRPAFQSIELDDPIDARLEARAAEKGIPTLVTPKAEQPMEITPPATAATSEVPPRKAGRGPAKEATPRSRMKGLKVELPDYVWIALKKRAAEEMVSLPHIIMTSLREKGIPINDADMVEDGRRFRD